MILRTVHLVFDSFPLLEGFVFCFLLLFSFLVLIYDMIPRGVPIHGLTNLRPTYTNNGLEFLISLFLINLPLHSSMDSAVETNFFLLSQSLNGATVHEDAPWAAQPPKRKTLNKTLIMHMLDGILQ